MCLRSAVLFALLAVGISHTESLGADWPRFRGPNGSGISEATTVPVEWDADDYNWQVELPGKGHSSPVIWEDKLFLTAATPPPSPPSEGGEPKEGRRWLLCYHVEDGRKLWELEFPFEKHPKHRMNTFAACTPAVDADHVYVLWQSKTDSALVAVDHQGRRVWRFELGPFRGGHGPGTSPIVYEDLVIVCHDHEGPSFRVAVDRRTGEERWRIERPGRRACYSTPCIYRPDDGPPQIICVHSYQGITSIDPGTGGVNWEVKPFGEFPQRAIASPVVFKDLIIAGSGFTTGERNVVAVRPERSNGSWQVEEAFRLSRGAPHIPTHLVSGGLLFLWDDRGIVTCADAETGERLWQKRVGGRFFSSPICIDGNLYCADHDGVVVVLDASRQYKLLARNPLGESTAATPAVADGIMYLRTKSHLFSLGGR